MCGFGFFPSVIFVARQHALACTARCPSVYCRIPHRNDCTYCQTYTVCYSRHSSFPHYTYTKF